MKTILFVCTANICRSPMAEALMRKKIQDMGLEGEIEVKSAGVYAMPDRAASSGTLAVLQQRGITLDGHRSQPLTASVLCGADIVLVMEESHRNSAFHLAPSCVGKVFLLSEMSRSHREVSDPYGGPAEAYRRTADLVESMIAKGMPQILKFLGVEAQPERR